MTQKKLVLLLAALAVLSGFYFMLLPGAGRRHAEHVNLLAGVDSDQVARFVLEQGVEKLEVRNKDGVWTIPARGDYPASEQEIGKLFFKLFDLVATQKVPAGSEGIKKLGLDEEGIKAGRSRITFFDKEGKQLGGLFLGQLRERRQAPDIPVVPGMTGQFVRLLDEDRVYLVGTPVLFTLLMSEWLDTNLLNVRVGKVLSVVQKVLAGATDEAKAFELVRPAEEDNGKDFMLQPAPGGDEETQATLVSQVASGLENLKFSDVKQADDAVLHNLVWDRETVYLTDSGLVYRVTTAKDQDKVYAKVRVAFDEALAKEIQARADAKKAEAERLSKDKEAAEAADAAKSQDVQAEQQSTAASPSPSPAPETKPDMPKIEPQLSNSDEAIKQNSRLEPWIFELAAYQGDKFRKSFADLIKKKEIKTEAPGGLETPGT
ncbi:MAG TPA: DUF4340 domain-containing protein [Oligoflexia bacterium]|nr:DUF4340 domain-containing protein [Oligoflexia bacterium]